LGPGSKPDVSCAILTGSAAPLRRKPEHDFHELPGFNAVLTVVIPARRDDSAIHDTSEVRSRGSDALLHPLEDVRANKSLHELMFLAKVR
jgi:hypothetical protein